MTLLDRILKLYGERIHLERELIKVVEFVVSSYIAFRMNPTKLPWSWVIGPPGGFKTECLRSFSGLADAFYGGEYISNAGLLSGYKDPTPRNGTSNPPWKKKKKPKNGEAEPNPHSLATFLDGKMMLVGDGTHFTSSDPRATARLWSDFRVLYDGEASPKHGNVEGITKYKARFGVIIGVTNKVDALRMAQADLGERFLAIRFSPKEQLDACRRVAANVFSDASVWFKELPDRMVEIFQDIPLRLDIRGVEAPQHLIERIIENAQIIATLRTHVNRSGSGIWSTIEYAPDPEVPTRITAQLSAILAGHAYVMNRDYLHEDDMSFLRDVAHGSIPARPLLYAQFLYENRLVTTADAGKALPFGSQTSYTCLEDLVALGVAMRDDTVQGGSSMPGWRMRPEFRASLDRVNFFGTAKVVI